MFVVKLLFIHECQAKRHPGTFHSSESQPRRVPIGTMAGERTGPSRTEYERKTDDPTCKRMFESDILRDDLNH